MKLYSRLGIGVVMIEIEGNVDTRSASEFEGGLRPHLDSPEPRLILDFSRVDYISSSGLRVLLSAYKTARTKNGEIRCIGVVRSVKEIFEIAGLSRQIPIFPDRGRALVNFGLEVNELKDRAIPIYRLGGNLEPHASPFLVQWLNHLLEKPETSFVLDFSLVEYAAIECLRALHTASAKAGSSGRALVLLGVQQAVHESFEVSGLDLGPLKLAHSIESALALLTPDKT